MSNTPIVIAALIIAPTAQCLFAQGSHAGPFGSLLSFSSSTVSRTWDPSAYTTKIRNRSAVLGNETSGSLTRFFSVTDRDLRGKGSEEVLQRLSPVVSTADRKVKMEILIDLKRPTTLVSFDRKPVGIGTAVITSPTVKDVSVNATIFANNLRVLGK
jgi:hypothetical protein